MQAEAGRAAVVQVELEIGAPSPRGVAIRAGAPPQPFWGWLELIQVLQNIIYEDLATARESSKERA
jgi:hypothetical protein